MPFDHPAARPSWRGVALAVLVTMPGALAAAEQPALPELPLPPPIEALIGMPQTFTGARSIHLAIVARRAEEAGLPPAVADAVAQVESAYNPNVVGGVGEVGLMQIRPQTAAMLGYKGDRTGLFDPETNVQYGVAYLARAWRLANGDLCRALMKYRAGHGEERMTPLSVEYCRRARRHLAAIGSPLAQGAPPPAATAPVPAFAAGPIATAKVQASPGRIATVVPMPALKPVAKSAAKIAVSRVPAKATRVAKLAAPLPPPRPERVRMASTSEDAARTQAMRLLKARQEQRRKAWAEHDARLSAIEAKLKRSRLTIASRI